MDINRRSLLRAGGVAAATGLAGCVFTANRVQELPRPFLGAENGAPVVRVFEDYRCPFCKRFENEEFPSIRENLISTGDVRYEHYDFPLPVDDLSIPAHNAARSVQDNSSVEDFWSVRRRLLVQQDSISEMQDVARLCARESDVGANQILNDMRQQKYLPVIQSDIETGEQTGIGGTPAIFVNGRSIEPTYQAVQEAINQITSS